MSVLDVVRERGVIRIAVAYSPPPEEGHPPEFFLDRESGEPSGVVPALGRVMARDLGVQPEYVDLSWPEHMRGLLADRVDLLMSYTPTPERALEVEFAGRLLPSEVVMMVPANSPVHSPKALEQPGERIGIWHGSSLIHAARNHFPKAQFLEFAEPLVALKSGQVEAAVVDAVTTIFMEKNPELRLLRDENGVLVILAPEYGHPAVRPGDQRFLNWINNWLDFHRAQGTIHYWCHTYWRSWMAR
jgi:polar amino acid transport system substrate-binding protein